MTSDLFEPAEIPFNLKGELLDNALTVEGQRRLDAEREAEARKAQGVFLCPKDSNTLRFYDGCLGYESLRCDACGFEQDLNWKANGNPNHIF